MTTYILAKNCLKVLESSTIETVPAIRGEEEILHSNSYILKKKYNKNIFCNVLFLTVSKGHCLQ